MVQLCSRFNRATTLVNFDGAVTGLNDVRERLVKTDRAFLFVCLFFPTNPLFPRVWQDRGRMSTAPNCSGRSSSLILPAPQTGTGINANKRGRRLARAALGCRGQPVCKHQRFQPNSCCLLLFTEKHGNSTARAAGTILPSLGFDVTQAA